MRCEISEDERFPLLTPAGRLFLHAMRQDRCAPIWNWPNGEQLDAAGLERVQQFAANLSTRPVFRPEGLPDWLASFVEFCLEEVPFYRRRAPFGTAFQAIPSCERGDLAGQPWDFVPDSQSLDRLIVFSSSGTTGHPAQLPTHPATAAAGIPLIEHALASTGVAFPRGTDRMALTNLVAYRGAYTTAIVITYLEEAGCIRVNLCDEDWRDPEHCRAYLDRWHAPVMLGDPLAFAALERTRIAQAPRVMISSVMTLSDALASDLSARYGSQVIDLYALTEAGIVAMKTPAGHRILPPDLYVEILDEHDAPCPPGMRGEITLTGGRNPFAPLLRYRTGDFAALSWDGGHPVLIGLEGRQPVLYVTSRGRTVHSMEISRALRSLPLVQFRMNQDERGLFQLFYRGHVDSDALRAAMSEVLGADEPLDIDELPVDLPRQRKLRQFDSQFRQTGETLR
jgi:phenylacetate-CoA ligase